MDLFRYASFTIASEFPLVELPHTIRDRDSPAAISLQLLPSTPSEPAPVQWIHHWRSAGDTTDLCLARTPGGFLLRFPDLADFVITSDGREIGAWPLPGCTPETLRHLVLDQVLPRVLAHRGSLMLHAGGVCARSRAIAFIGESGAGKSTLVASFQSGSYPLLSDDGLVLTLADDGIHVLPTYPSIRLWPGAVEGLFAEPPELAPMAHYSTKHRLLLPAEQVPVERPVPMAALFVLVSEDGTNIPAVTQLSPSAACMAIISNTFQLDLTDQQRTAMLLRVAARVAEHIPVYELRYPRDFSRLAEVRAAILNHAV